MPDSFKSSISSVEAAKSIKKGLKKYLPKAKLIEIPISDGGEGFIDAILHNVGGRKQRVTIIDKSGKRFGAYYGIMNDEKTAIIESAMSIGINRYKDENILKRSSYNLGFLIKKVLSAGFRNIIIGLGGSGTNDAGIGMLSALGTIFYDENDEIIEASAENLSKIAEVDTSALDRRLKICKILTLADVINPIIGENSASNVYAKQKGASQNEIEILEKGMQHFTKVIKKQFGWDITAEKMLGAAGATAFSLKYFLKSKLTLGIDYMIKLTTLENKIKNADWVISGEGKYDSQTAYGKAIWGIKLLCDKYEVPLIILTGSSEHILKDRDHNVIDISSSGFSKEFSMKHAKKLLTHYGKFISWMISQKEVNQIDTSS